MIAFNIILRKLYKKFACKNGWCEFIYYYVIFFLNVYIFVRYVKW